MTNEELHDLANRLPQFPATAYQLYRPLLVAGAGTKGTIYLCYERKPIPADTSSRPQIIAVKVIHEKIPFGSSNGARALQKIKKKVAQPQNFVRLLELEYMDKKPLPWYSMRVIRGCTLEKFFGKHDKPCPVALCFHIFGGCISGIQWLRNLNMCYQDFTTENVMLELDGMGKLPRVVLIDLDEVGHGSGWEPGVSLSYVHWMMKQMRRLRIDDLPLEWEDSLGEVGWKTLMSLCTMITAFCEFKITCYERVDPGDKEYWAWMRDMGALMKRIEALHEPQIVKEIVDVVESLWDEVEKELAESVKGEGMEVNSCSNLLKRTIANQKEGRLTDWA